MNRHAATVVRDADVLVVGGGGSGVLAALEASGDPGLSVVLLAKGPVGRSGLTPTANGGTATAGDPARFFRELVEAGRWLNDQELAWRLACRVDDDLARLHAELGIEIAPFRPYRVVVPPIELLERAAGRLAERPNATVIEDMLVTRLLTADGRIAGATALDLASGELIPYRARAVVLATGGAVGELYPRSSNNPLGVTTDAAASGHAMAWRAGAELLDMEMIQFVPLPADPDCENLRYTPEFWKGPYHDADGNVIEDDVARYDGGTYAYPFVRLLFDHATRHGPVYIDQRDRPPPAASKLRIWQARRRRIQQLGIDPAGRRIEITVGSHFAMGGVRVAPTTATTLPGLFAAGEIMGGVHGAHRLSGFSFSQMISFGYEAGARAAEHARGTASPVPLDGGTVADEAARLHALSADKPRAVALRTLKSELRRIMHDHLFLVRNAAGLRCAIERLAVLRERLPRLAVPPATAYNLDRMRAIEFGYTLDAAELITRSALARQESRGHHFRDDYPAEDDTRLPQHTVARRVDGQPRIDLEPVVLSRLQPEVRQWKAS